MYRKLVPQLLLILALATGTASAQTTEITTEHLMTFYAPLDAQQIDSSLTVFNVRDGGWVKGPKINGKLLSPTADWLRTMPGGSFRVDVRGTIKTDDGALVYITYGGVISYPKESLERLVKGEVLTSKDFLKLIRFRGHPILLEFGDYDAEIKNALPTGIPAEDSRISRVWANARRLGPGVRAVCGVDPELGQAGRA